MKIKVILFCLVTVLIITACGKHKSELYILTTTVHGSDDKEVRKDSLTMIDSDYFETSLESMSNGTIYRAGKELVKPSIDQEFQMTFFEIVAKDRTSLRFKTSGEFLKFMSSKGYEMTDQTKYKYHTDYTFKRK